MFAINRGNCTNIRQLYLMQKFCLLIEVINTELVSCVLLIDRQNTTISAEAIFQDFLLLTHFWYHFTPIIDLWLINVHFNDFRKGGVVIGFEVEECTLVVDVIEASNPIID